MTSYFFVFLLRRSCVHEVCTAEHQLWEYLVIHASKKFWFWESRPYVRPPLHVSRDTWNFAFQVPAHSVGHRIATQTFRDKKQQQQIKADPFFQLNFNVYIIGVDNREKARARDKKQMETWILLEELYENFIAAVRKWEMLVATKVKMSGSKNNGVSEVSFIIILLPVIYASLFFAVRFMVTFEKTGKNISVFKSGYIQGHIFNLFLIYAVASNARKWKP